MALRQKYDRPDTAANIPVSRSRVGRKSVWAMIVCFLVLGAVVAIACLQLLAARRDLATGGQLLHGVQLSVGSPAQFRQEIARGQMRVSLHQARSRFASAREDLRLWSPLLDHLGWLPSAGKQLSLAAPTADAAFYSTDAAANLLDGVGPVLDASAATHAHGPLLERIFPVIARNDYRFARARSSADAATSALARIPAHSGNSTLDNASAQLRGKLPLLRTTSHWLANLPGILGMHGTRHYLVLLQNPAELRATGGFIGGVDLVTISNGHMNVRFSGTKLPHEITGVPPPLPEAVYTPEQYWILRDSNWSPDFRLTARVARWFYGEDTGMWVDGVLGTVDTVVQPLLRATGPVHVPEYHRWVNAQNVEPLAQTFVHSGFHGPQSSGSPDTLRKQFLGYVVAAVLKKAQSLSLDRWPVLGKSLSESVRNHDIMLYDHRQQVEKAAIMSGLDGRLLPTTGDSLFVVDDNRSYSKLNPYVTESGTYKVRILPNRALQSTLTLHYHVAHSPETIEGIGPGAGWMGTKHDYQDFVRVYVPAGAHLIGMSGLAPWAPQQAYGLTQFAGRLFIRAGGSATVILRYSVPPSALRTLGSQRYSLHIRRQPGGNLSALGVRIRVDDAAAGTTRDVANTVLHLSTDVSLSAPLGGTQAHMTPLTLLRASGNDPNVPLSLFHDAKHSL